MAGCFGNSDYDRHIERQLMQHLNAEGDYENYLEFVSNEIEPEMWDSGLDVYFDSDEAQKMLGEYYHSQGPDISYKHMAEKIVNAYMNHLINQDAKRSL